MQTAPKKVINAWAMYDWANSVYNLVITTTFFPIYFLAVTKRPEWDNGEAVPFLGGTFRNSSLYDYCLAFAYFLVAISYPVLTSIADTRGSKKKFLQSNRSKTLLLKHSKKPRVGCERRINKVILARLNQKLRLPQGKK